MPSSHISPRGSTGTVHLLHIVAGVAGAAISGGHDLSFLVLYDTNSSTNSVLILADLALGNCCGASVHRELLVLRIFHHFAAGDGVGTAQVHLFETRHGGVAGVLADDLECVAAAFGTGYFGDLHFVGLRVATRTCANPVANEVGVIADAICHIVICDAFLSVAGVGDATRKGKGLSARFGRVLLEPFCEVIGPTPVDVQGIKALVRTSVADDTQHLVGEAAATGAGAHLVAIGIPQDVDATTPASRVLSAAIEVKGLALGRRNDALGPMLVPTPIAAANVDVIVACAGFVHGAMLRIFDMDLGLQQGLGTAGCFTVRRH